MKKCVFLDRDGTINYDSGYLNDTKNIKLIPKSIKGMQMLQKHGYLLIIISNQSGVGRGYFDYNTMLKIDNKIKELLLKKNVIITDSFYCPYYDKSKISEYKKNYYDRKPNPGMLIKAAEKYSIDMKNSFMIGDKTSDVQAGKNAGCKTIFIGKKNKSNDINPDYICNNLMEGAKWIISHIQKK